MKYGGSWIHPDLAVQLAQWISPIFALQVSEWVRELASTGTVSILREELLNKEKQLKQLSVKHENIKKKRNYHKFKQGPYFYIISDIESGCLKYKAGIEEVDVNVRMATHRSTTPGVKIEYLCYTDKCGLIEDAILQKYEKNRKYLNHEWIYDVDIKDIIVNVKTLINFLELKVEVEDDVSKYNNQIKL